MLFWTKVTSQNARRSSYGWADTLTNSDTKFNTLASYLYVTNSSRSHFPLWVLFRWFFVLTTQTTSRGPHGINSGKFKQLKRSCSRSGLGLKVEHRANDERSRTGRTDGTFGDAWLRVHIRAAMADIDCRLTDALEFTSSRWRHKKRGVSCNDRSVCES